MAITIHVRKTIANDDSWWKSLTKEQQKTYIEQHPNSKYAKNAKHVEEKESTKHKNNSTIKAKFEEKVSQLPKEHKEFFENEQDKPGSKARRSAADHIRTSGKEIIDHIKGQVKEWKTGCNAIGKLASGESISDHEKKALKALVIDAVVTASVVTVTGGFSHGIALACKHISFDILKDVIIKGVVKKTSHAMGTSLTSTGLMQALTYASSIKDPIIRKRVIKQMTVSGWFDFLSKDKKEEYLEDHPNSKLAMKGMGKKTDSKLTVKKLESGQYGVFGTSGTCYLKDVSKQRAEDYVEKQMEKRRSASPSSSGGSMKMSYASDKNQDAKNEKILENLVEQIAKMVEKGMIPEEAWEKAMDELIAKGKKTKNKTVSSEFKLDSYWLNLAKQYGVKKVDVERIWRTTVTELRKTGLQPGDPKYNATLMQTVKKKLES